MKTRFITTALIASVAAGALAAPTISSAQPYRYYDDCRVSEHSNGAAGAVIGGIAGALLGSSLAPHHGNRAGGAAIGGVTGAIVGNSIGRSSGKSNCYSQGYYRDGRYYSYDSRGYYAPTYSYPTYSYNGRYYSSDPRYSGYYQPYDYGRRSYAYPY
jgi:hypothetical protein